MAVSIIEIMKAKAPSANKRNNEELEKAAKELIDAVQAQDVAGVTAALRDAYDACTDEPSEEPSEEEEGAA